MRAILVLFILVVIVAATVWLWPRLEGEAPILSGPDRIELGAAPRTVELGWADAQTGLRHVEAYLEVGSGESAKRIDLHSNDYRGDPLTGPVLPTENETFSATLEAKVLGLPEGDSHLVLAARDWSWSDGRQGNLAELRIPIRVDTKPPRVSVESGLTYVRRGGAGVVAFRTSADAERSGVRVGDAWFDGVPQSGGGQIAVFAIPIDAAADPVVEVVAVDRVGNEASTRFDARVQEREFPEITIALSQRFLDRVAVRLGEENEMTEVTPLATFQRVNSELRQQNEATILGAIGPPSAKQWSGGFEQMKNSSVTSKFAELRHYTSGGARVSIARHFGFDLASTQRAEITAANAGTVIFAAENGIYGTLVLIDHGLGITTLYGHLSQLAATVGDRVEKGQILGRSGATGLAGGDHLHFAALVGQTYVDPVEWWDPKWVREHVEVRLDSPTPE